MISVIVSVWFRYCCVLLWCVSTLFCFCFKPRQTIGNFGILLFYCCKPQIIQLKTNRYSFRLVEREKKLKDLLLFWRMWVKSILCIQIDDGWCAIKLYNEIPYYLDITLLLLLTIFRTTNIRQQQRVNCTLLSHRKDRDLSAICSLILKRIARCAN